MPFSLARRRTLGLLLLATAAAFTACSDPTAPDGARSAIVYSLRVYGNPWRELFLLPADGASSQPVSALAGDKLSPTWSPDGGTLAFLSETMSNGIWLANAEGTDLRRVPTDDYGIPAWSPDGTWLAFADYDVPGHTVIEAVHPDGSGRRTLVSHVSDISPFTTISWSGAGRIAFKRSNGVDYGTGNIWSVKSDGTGLVQMTTGMRDEGPIWSPDGTMLAFTSGGPTAPGSEVVVVNADGSGRRTVVASTNVAVSNRVAAWSPDGRWLVFERLETPIAAAASCDYFKVAIDGTRVEERVSHEPYANQCGGAAWR